MALMVNVELCCPACGFDLGFPPWKDGLSSFEICPSCGIQFGYTDMAPGDPIFREGVYLEWRRTLDPGRDALVQRSKRPTAMLESKTST